MSSSWVVAVHGGAGYHSTDAHYEKSLKHALKSACSLSAPLLSVDGGRSIDAVERAIRYLEDIDCLNAGTGSNLTLDGQVECDASIVDGTTQHFGSVGAVQGVKNPVSVARAIMDNSRVLQPLGRVPPLTLVGGGAHDFACSRGLEIVPPESLITDSAMREWKKWKARLAEAEKAGEKKQQNEITTTLAMQFGHTALEDTVGAVACHTNGTLAAGVSSGGLLLKHTGRIGEAAVYGAGTWASTTPDASFGVACSVSGTGEDIIRTNMARTLADAITRSKPEDAHDAIYNVLQEFCASCRSQGQNEPNAGALVILKESYDSDENESSDEESEAETSDARAGNSGDFPPSGSAEHLAQRKRAVSSSTCMRLRFWCAFTTPSMAIAYTSLERTGIRKPKALILRQPCLHPEEKKNRICIVSLPLHEDSQLTTT